MGFVSPPGDDFLKKHRKAKQRLKQHLKDRMTKPAHKHVLKIHAAKWQKKNHFLGDSETPAKTKIAPSTASANAV